MNTQDALVTGLRNSLLLLERYVNDLTPEQMLHRPCSGANCCAWILGHLALSDRHFMKQMGVAPEQMPPLPEGFEQRFGQGDNAPAATDFGDTSGLFDLVRQTREVMIQAAERMDEAQLDAGSSMDHPFFNTAGAILAFMPIHMAMHTGQITLIRRSLGMPPVI